MTRALMLLLIVGCSSPASSQRQNPPQDRTTPAPPTAITKSDRAVVAQQMIDLKELQQYFHGRKPLRIVVNRSVNPAWKLTFEGDPIEWVDETTEEPHLIFTVLRVEGDKAAAQLRYPIEGVVLHAEFRRAGQGWAVADFELAEE